MRTLVVLIAAVLAACGGVQQRFPDEVQAALAHDDMRRLETDRFIIYYPAHRRAEIDRFVARAGRCAESLRRASLIHTGPWRDKMVIAMPEAAFNNAFVSAEGFGYEHVSVIPTLSTLDFTTEFGLVPDPGYIACHELTHYVHLEQIAGFWRLLDAVFGHLYSPQTGYDPWFLEGLATHYEQRLSGIGRPSWPIFTGMFAAAYAGHHINGGDMSEYGRLAPVGHHYLVGTMFMRFVTERYGEPPLWAAIADEAHALTGWLFAGTFKRGFGTSFPELMRQFNDWSAKTFPVRLRPSGQRTVATLGNDARYARGRDGTEAWVADDVDVPARLVVRAPDGGLLAEVALVDVLPPRTLVQADPLNVSGLSITGDGREVWLTVIDPAATFQVPRLLRWRRGEGLRELSDELGPGATIDPGGRTYYYCAVDGDRWSLAAWDVASGGRRVLLDMPAGTYALAAQASPDGARLVVNVWNGQAFVAWIIDAATGARLGELAGDGPIWDASFTGDGRISYLGVVDGRFQLFLDGHAITDAPYAVLAAREARGTIRFMNRDGWEWTLDEVAAPAAPAAESAPATSAAPATSGEGLQAPLSSPDAPPAATDAPPAATVVSDEPFSVWDHFFFPQLRAPIVVGISNDVPMLGAVIGGGDRLGMQRWSISGYAQPAVGSVNHKTHFGGDVEYLNTMLAPWQILAAADWIDWTDSVATTDPKVTLPEDRRTRDVSLSLSRTWRGELTAALSGVYTDDFDAFPGEMALRRHLGGPSLSLAFASAESTAYTGARRALYATASAAYYPHALSSFAGDIYDTSGSLGATVPLPLGRRHTLTALVRGRALVANDDTSLLQLGGVSQLPTLVSGSSVGGEPGFDTTRFPPNLRFTEFLRGYEDYAITTDRAAIADLSWRYPLIIDQGYAATFGILPATFVREIDLELFGSGAVDRRGQSHAAAGGQLTLRMILLRFPVVLAYQLSRRVRDDDALTQLLSMAFSL